MDGAGVGLVNLFLFLGIIGLTTYNILRPNNKMDSTRRTLYLLSLVSVIVSAVTIGHRVDAFGHHYFNSFSEIFFYRGGGFFSFNVLGFLISFYLFYWIFKLMLKLWKAITVKKDH